MLNVHFNATMRGATGIVSNNVSQVDRRIGHVDVEAAVARTYVGKRTAQPVLCGKTTARWGARDADDVAERAGGPRHQHGVYRPPSASSSVVGGGIVGLEAQKPVVRGVPAVLEHWYPVHERKARQRGRERTRGVVCGLGGSWPASGLRVNPTRTVVLGMNVIMSI